MSKGTIALAVLATAAAAWDVAVADTAEELRQAEQKWAELFAAEDAEGLAQMYTEDAMRLPPDATRIVGREAIQASLEGDIEAGIELELETTDIGYDGDLGWVVGDQTVRFPMGDTMGTATGNYIIIYRRGDDGVWRIVVDTWNDAP